MQIRPEQLARHLEQELKPLYVVYGDAPLLVLEATDSIRQAARRQGFDERESLTVLPRFDWQELTMAAGSLSLFGGKKIVDLSIPTAKPGREGGAALQAFCQRLANSPQGPVDLLTIITLPDIGWQEAKSAWFTALVQTGVAIKLSAPGLAELPDWLAARLHKQQQSADPEGLRFIAERVEGNLLAAHQEIQKLALLYPQGALSLEQIRQAVHNVARYDIDGLREALLSGDAGRLMRTLHGLEQEGEAAVLVLWAFSEEIRTLTAISRKQGKAAPSDALFKEMKVWGPRQALMRRALQRLSFPMLVAQLRHAAQIDRLIKGIGKGNVWEEFARLGLAMSTAAGK